MLHFSYSQINGADFWTVVDLFNQVVRSKHTVYRNRLQESDLKVPLCGFGSVKCVCFFVWNLELILSSFEDRSSDSVLPCLLLLHCQVRCCKSTQITLKVRKNKDDSKGFLKICKLISKLTLSQIIVSNLTNVHKLNTRINYARIHWIRYKKQTSNTIITLRAWPTQEKSKATVFPPCNSWLNFRIVQLIVRHINTTYSKNPRVRTYFFRVWQNRFLYFGVLTGILG